MAHTIYYIDSENIFCSDWPYLYPELEKGDAFIIFYTKNVSGIPVEILDTLRGMGVSLRYILCNTGKNALDFQLVSVLGYGIANQGNTYCYRIVSRDTGYDPVVKYWKNLSYDVARTAPPAKDPEPKKETPSILEHINILMACGLSRQEAEFAYRCLSLHPDLQDGQKLCEIHNDLIKKYGTKKGQTIYKNVKNCLSRL